MQLLIVDILIHGVNYDIKNVLWLSKSFLTIDDLLFADTKVMNIFNIVLAVFIFISLTFFALEPLM